jgi:hypothetical protein
VEDSDLKPLIFDYFANLFTLEVNGTYFRFLEKIQPQVTNVMNEQLMSTNASILVDSVRPPSAEVCRTSTSFP